MLPELLPQSPIFSTWYQADTFPLLLQVPHIIANFVTLLAGKQPLRNVEPLNYEFTKMSVRNYK